MVKGWADHCSSDEEDDDHETTGVMNVIVGGPPVTEDLKPQAEPQGDEEVPRTTAEERVYEYPTEPPFTAYVGNLAYSIVDPQDLAAEVKALASEKLHVSIHVVNARVMKDRHNNDRPRGFGYVEVETVEMLQQLMELNATGDAKIAGRKVTFDVSNSNTNNSNNSGGRRNSHRSGSEANIDGTKFRGGRYAGSNQTPAASSMTAAESKRPSLKLKPRTKPVDDEDEDIQATRTSQTNIFGAAKARDEISWIERRSSEAGVDSAGGERHHPQPRKDSGTNPSKGRGGRNGSRGGRGDTSGRTAGGRQSETGGRGGNDRGKKKKTELHKPQAPLAQAPKSAPPVEVEKALPKKETVTNAFAALAMDSDSD